MSKKIFILPIKKIPDINKSIFQCAIRSELYDEVLNEKTEEQRKRIERYNTRYGEFVLPKQILYATNKDIKIKQVFDENCGEFKEIKYLEPFCIKKDNSKEIYLVNGIAEKLFSIIVNKQKIGNNLIKNEDANVIYEKFLYKLATTIKDFSQTMLEKKSKDSSKYDIYSYTEYQLYLFLRSIESGNEKGYHYEISLQEVDDEGNLKNHIPDEKSFFEDKLVNSLSFGNDGDTENIEDSLLKIFKSKENALGCYKQIINGVILLNILYKSLLPKSDSMCTILDLWYVSRILYKIRNTSSAIDISNSEITFAKICKMFGLGDLTVNQSSYDKFFGNKMKQDEVKAELPEAFANNWIFAQIINNFRALLSILKKDISYFVSLEYIPDIEEVDGNIVEKRQTIYKNNVPDSDFYKKIERDLITDDFKTYKILEETSDYIIITTGTYKYLSKFKYLLNTSLVDSSFSFYPIEEMLELGFETKFDERWLNKPQYKLDYIGSRMNVLVSIFKENIDLIEDKRISLSKIYNLFNADIRILQNKNAILQYLKKNYVYDCKFEEIFKNIEEIRKIENDKYNDCIKKKSYLSQIESWISASNLELVEPETAINSLRVFDEFKFENGEQELCYILSKNGKDSEKFLVGLNHKYLALNLEKEEDENYEDIIFYIGKYELDESSFENIFGKNDQGQNFKIDFSVPQKIFIRYIQKKGFDDIKAVFYVYQIAFNKETNEKCHLFFSFPSLT